MSTLSFGGRVLSVLVVTLFGLLLAYLLGPVFALAGAWGGVAIMAFRARATMPPWIAAVVVVGLLAAAVLMVWWAVQPTYAGMPR